MPNLAASRDRFAQMLGIELLASAPGSARARLSLRPEFLNGVGTAHGGLIFTLADYTFAVAANGLGTAVALNAAITFLAPGRQGDLTAEATEVSRQKRVGSYQVLVRDDTGTIIASFQGLAYYKAA